MRCKLARRELVPRGRSHLWAGRTACAPGAGEAFSTHRTLFARQARETRRSALSAASLAMGLDVDPSRAFTRRRRPRPHGEHLAERGPLAGRQGEDLEERTRVVPGIGLDTRLDSALEMNEPQWIRVVAD